MNPASTSAELHHLVEDSGASVLVYGQGQATAVSGLAGVSATSLVCESIALTGSDGGRSLASIASSMPTEAPVVEVFEDDDSMIIYTSGTTGRPKGALFDHHRQLWTCHMMAGLGLRSNDVILHAAPLYHCAELVLMLMTGFVYGASHVVVPKFNPAEVLDLIAEHSVTAFLGVPTMYQQMLLHADAKERDLSTWRIGYFGAAPMPAHEVRKLVATWPDVEFMQLYGQTEAGPMGSYLPYELLVAHPDVTGRFSFPFANMRLVDVDGNDVAPGEPGEILLRGETVMKEYWRNPQATAEALKDGWLHTGDIAVEDGRGCHTIVDRLKDMIITGGRNVYSVEVEQAIAGHPDVIDVAVIGIPHEVYGESILAVITPRPDSAVTLESVREFAGQTISHYKLPHDILLQEIPRNASGKLLKHVIRAELKGTSDEGL
jgi:fatty-acyl-CoA synthase